MVSKESNIINLALAALGIYLIVGKKPVAATVPSTDGGGIIVPTPVEPVYVPPFEQPIIPVLPELPQPPAYIAPIAVLPELPQPPAYVPPFEQPIYTTPIDVTPPPVEVAPPPVEYTPPPMEYTPPFDPYVPEYTGGWGSGSADFWNSLINTQWLEGIVDPTTFDSYQGAAESDQA